MHSRLHGLCCFITTESNLSHPHTDDCGAICWSLLNIPRATSLKKTDCVSSRQLSIAPRFGWGLMNPFLIHAAMLTGVDLIQVLCRQPQLCQFTMPQSCQEYIWIYIQYMRKTCNILSPSPSPLPEKKFLILIFLVLGSTFRHILVQGGIYFFLIFITMCLSISSSLGPKSISETLLSKGNTVFLIPII